MEQETFDFAKYQLEGWDFVILFIYFAGIIRIGFWCSKNNSDDDSVDREAQYFLASRSMSWIPVGASLVASNLGPEHILGLAGGAATNGVAIASYELNAAFILILLGWLYLPVYYVSGVPTLPQYMRKRFGSHRLAVVLTILFLSLYILTKVSAVLAAGSMAIKYTVGTAGNAGLYISNLILPAVAAAICVSGGLVSVIWTELVQMILMVVGGLIMMVLGLIEVGGYESLFDKYSVAEPAVEFSAFEYDPKSGVNISCGAVSKDFAHIFHSADSQFFPWMGMVPGMIVSSVCYWCSDMIPVQKLLAAKNISHAKGGVVLAGILKLLPFFMFVLMGMAARVLFPNEVICSKPEKCQDICDSDLRCNDLAYIFLVLKLAPLGVRGFMMTVIFITEVTSLTSIFHSSSTLFTYDIWKLIRKNPSATEAILVGRSFVVIMVLMVTAWIPVITQISDGRLFINIQIISIHLFPPISAIFLIAILWHRVSEPGVFWALIVGTLIGIARLIMQFCFLPPSCGSGLPDLRPDWIKIWVDDFHYLHFGTALFLFTLIIASVISIFTSPIQPEKLHRLTVWTKFSLEPGSDEPAATPNSVQSSFNIIRWLFATGNANLKSGLMNLCCLKADVVKKDLDVGSTQQSPEEKRKKLVDSIKEDNQTQWYINYCSAVVVMCCATFIFAFYA